MLKLTVDDLRDSPERLPKSVQPRGHCYEAQLRLVNGNPLDKAAQVGTCGFLC